MGGSRTRRARRLALLPPRIKPGTQEHLGLLLGCVALLAIWAVVVLLVVGLVYAFAWLTIR